MLLASDYLPAPGFQFTAEVQIDKFYVLLATKFSDEPTEISLGSGPGSTASTDCDVVFGINIDLDKGTATVAESGATDSYTVNFRRQPIANVTVNIATTLGEVVP